MKYILATCIFYTIGIFFNEKFTNLQFLTFAFFITLIIVLINLIFKKASNILLILLCLISSVFGAYWYLYRFPEKDVNDLYYYSPLNNITIEGVVTSEPKLKNEVKTSQTKISFLFGEKSGQYSMGQYIK